MRTPAVHRLPGEDARPIQIALSALALLLLTLLLLLPLYAIFAHAFSEGVSGWWATFGDEDVRHAIGLSLLTAAIAVPIDVVFGLAAAWLLTRYRFRGRALLLAMIELPFTVSPVVSGFVFILLFGASGVLAPVLHTFDLQVVFAPLGIILTTIFVTSPFVARELIPLMEAQGDEEELAALTLGANAWQMWARITLPKSKWALLYGVLLCNARAMGEFGAVSVVSGMVRGRTCTLPLMIEILYNEYQTRAAFATASLLTALALLTLVAKEWVNYREHKEKMEALS